MENKVKCYGYARVSTSEQENSLDVQSKRIREYCTFQNMDIVEILVDENISGFTEIYKRPAGKKLASMGDVKNIVTIKPDRLFRNLKDALITVDEWDQDEISLHLVDVGGASLNTKTAIGRLMFSTIISFSEFERNITGERIKAVLNNKKASKKTYNSKVLGYDNVEGQMIPNIQEQEIINYIKILHAKEYGPTRIAKALNRFGYRTKTKKKFLPSTIQAVMGNSLHKQESVNN